jgi:mono/diheme cytochrome c family protein
MPLRLVRAIALPLLAGAAATVLGVSRRQRIPNPVPVGMPPAPQGDQTLEPVRVPGPLQVTRRGIYLAVAVILLIAGGVAAGYQIKFTQKARARAIELTAGNPDLGRQLTRRYGCAGCHTIPGVPGSAGQVGPNLSGLAGRVYLGGVVNNTPDNMIQWIVNPREIDERSAMPATGISRTEARHVAAYLYTLQ